MTARLLPVVQGIATVLLLALLFRGFDWERFGALFVRLPLWFYAASLLVVLAGQVLYAWRWRVLLAATGTRVPLALVLRQYLVGLFVNNFLPSMVGGDAAKVFYLGRTHGYQAVTASIVLDRLLGFGLLAILATVTLWIEPVSHPRYVAARVALTTISGLFVGAIVVTLVGTGGLPRRLARFGEPAVRLASRAQTFRSALAGVVRSPAVWLQSIATVGSYLSLLTLVYAGFIWLQAGRQPGFLPLLMAITSLSVLSVLPIAINGLGLREQLHVLLLEPLGVDREIAVAISLLLFGHMLLASVAGGLVWWRTPAIRAAPTRTPADR